MSSAPYLRPPMLAAAAAAALVVYQTVAAQSVERGQSAPSPETAGGAQGVAVVELFTSQGCSSCPPADRVLKAVSELADENGLPIYALSMHVDYWDYLGWSDPYAATQFSQRQREYARATGSGRVYTPQMIVNGGVEFVGSNGKQAAAAIRAAVARRAAAEVALDVAVGKANQWRVDYAVTGAGEGDNLVVCLVADASANHVPRGENTGRDLSHVGVVRALKTEPLGADGRGSLPVSWPASQERGSAPPSIVAFVQNRATRQIHGATRWAPEGPRTATVGPQQR